MILFRERDARLHECKRLYVKYCRVVGGRIHLYYEEGGVAFRTRIHLQKSLRIAWRILFKIFEGQPCDCFDAEKVIFIGKLNAFCTRRIVGNNFAVTYDLQYFMGKQVSKTVKPIAEKFVHYEISHLHPKIAPLWSTIMVVFISAKKLTYRFYSISVLVK